MAYGTVGRRSDVVVDIKRVVDDAVAHGCIGNGHGVHRVADIGVPVEIYRQAVLDGCVAVGGVGGGDDMERHRQHTVGAVEGGQCVDECPCGVKHLVVPWQGQRTLADGAVVGGRHVAVYVEMEVDDAVATYEVGECNRVDGVADIDIVYIGEGEVVLDGGLVNVVVAYGVHIDGMDEGVGTSVAVHKAHGVLRRCVGGECAYIQRRAVVPCEVVGSAQGNRCAVSQTDV